MSIKNIILYSVFIFLVGCVAGEVGEKKPQPAEVGLSLSSISPNGGTPSGGTVVTITGTGLDSSTQINLGGSSCTVISANGTSLTCTTSAHALGVVNVNATRTTSTSTSSASITSGFTYRNPPTLTSVSPNIGSNQGSTSISLTGTGFVSGASVTIGVLSCSSVNVASPTSITCTIPSCGGSCPYSNGAVNVTVINSDNQSSGTQTYTFATTPNISAVENLATAGVSAGPLGGGTTIKITGSNFVSGATVSVGGVACTPVSFINSGELQCPTGTNTTGAKSVVVTNPDTTTATLANGFTYRAAPTVTSLSPNAGALAGSTSVTITGTGFVSGATVTFDPTGTAATCTSPTVVNSTTMTCTTSGHVAGAVDVRVTNPEGQLNTLASGYTYQAAPNVTAAYDKTICDASGPPAVPSCPSQISAGPLAGARQIYIVGTGFITGATATINSVTCTSPTVSSATLMTCTTPANAAGTYTVQVRNPDTQVGSLGSAYTYRAAPTITSFSPNAGQLAGGTTLTITGTNFVTGAVVTINGSVCTPGTLTSTQITCSTPSLAAGSYNVVVTNPDNQNVTSSSQYKYQGPPVFTSITPDGGPTAGFQTVTIAGTNFDTTNGMTVTIGGTACSSLSLASSTSLTCSTPVKTLGSYDVVLTNLDGNSQSVTATNAYTYRNPPIISDVYDLVKCDASGGPPACATKVRTEGLGGGNQIYIIGTGFLTSGTTTVYVGGLPCTGAIANSTTEIVCTTPAHTAGLKNVQVVNNDGQTGTYLNIYRYQNAPTITSITPNKGASAGGGFISVNGTGFDTVNGTSVTVNGVACTPNTFLSSTKVTCTVPAIGAGAIDTPYDVVVTLGDGDNQSVTSTGGFSYTGPPTVASITNNVGPTVGGQSVTITGTNFDTSNGATVSLGGTTCTSPTVVNSTTITCTTGSHSLGPVNVVVTNLDADNQSGTLVSGYSYQITPTISSIVPSSGRLAGGSIVTVNGNGFISDTITTVSIGGVPCVVQAAPPVTTTQLSCEVGSHTAGTYSAVVTNTNDGQTSTTASAFTYYPAPTISSITPSYGPVAGGGASVTVTGSNFISIGPSKPIIRFDPGGAAVDCASVTVVDSNTLTCASAPAHASGFYDVEVINPDGDAQSDTLSMGFSFWPQPTIIGTAPANGPESGGTTITITGTGLGGITGVTVGGVTCTSVTVVNSTTVTCITGAKPAGTHDVVVTSFDGQTGTQAGGFTFDPAPSISSVYNTATPSVSAGPLAGGTGITIDGANFVTGATVTVGGVTCTSPTVVTSSQITCTTGINSAGAKDVVVTNPDTQTAIATNGFNYRAAPTIASITLNAGSISGGTNITIVGTNFFSNAVVDMDPAGTLANCSIVSLNSSTIICTTSAHVAATVDVRITNEEGQTVTSTGGYTYQPAPTVLSLSVSNGPSSGGTAITITGTNFLAGATASFGGSNCTSLTVVSSSSITCTTTSHANGVVDVTVTNSDTQSGTFSSSYTYQGAPTISSISPAGGDIAGGTTITITGDQFYAGATVSIDPTGTAAVCTGPTVVNINTITCTTSSHSAGNFNVRVQNTDSQTGTLTNGFTYRPPPTISSISPNGGPLSGGTTVTITGNNFISGTTFAIGGVTCSSPVFVSSTTMTCVTGARTAATVNVVATLTDGQTGTLVSGFTYRNPPTVTGVDIASGSTTGGLMLTISGTGFVSGATVKIGTATCTSPTLVNSTTMTCITPAQASGFYSITVTNSDTQSGTMASAFEYTSMAQLQWQRGSSSPTPPDADTYGPTSINETHTYTLKNVGDAVSGAVTISVGGTNPTAWFKGTDTCNGNSLSPGASCTVQMTFLGAGLSSGSYSATINALSSPGDSDSNNMNGSVP